MSTTTIRVDAASRSRLSEVARTDFGGITQDAALNKLIDEHEMGRVHAQYDRLRSDPGEWAEYLNELQLTDNTSADSLGSAHDEYPEYTQ